MEQEAALREMMKNMNEGERDKILAQFQSEMDKLMSRQENVKQEQRDKIVSKLAARKRMREELDKEKAVSRELDRITKQHVNIYSYNWFSILLFRNYEEIITFTFRDILYILN